MSQFFFFLKSQLIRLFTVFCFSRKVTARSEKFSKALKLFHADSIALHEELKKAEANRSLGRSETEPKILSHGREKPVLYLFRTLFGLAQVTPESDSESSSLALLHWLSDWRPAPERPGPLGPTGTAGAASGAQLLWGGFLCGGHKAGTAVDSFSKTFPIQGKFLVINF